MRYAERSVGMFGIFGSRSTILIPRKVSVEQRVIDLCYEIVISKS